MTRWAIIVVGVIYAGIAAGFVYEKKYGMALTFGGYALSNIGLYLAA